MRKRRCMLAAIMGLAAMLALAGPRSAAGQELRGPLRIAAAAAADPAALRRFDVLVESLAGGGQLVALPRQADPDLPGRTHQHFQQFHNGVRVSGGGVSRQQAGGVTVSLLGTVVEDLDIDTAPRLQAAAALALLEQQTGVESLTGELPELVITPLPDGRYVLAYAAVMRDLRRHYLDAHAGVLVHHESIVRRQAAIGAGAGIQGQQKKLSTRERGGVYEARDVLRPAEIVTLDLRYDILRGFGLLMNGATWGDGDLASDADNVWSDPAVVDVHAHTGLVYDYFHGAHGWRGIDGKDTRIFSIVNFLEDFENAFYLPAPGGPEGQGVMVYGEWEDGAPLVALDVVGHELTHGVTHHTVLERTGEPLNDSYFYVLGPSGFTLADRTFRCGESETWDFRDTPEWRGRQYELLCEEGRLIVMLNVGFLLDEAWADIFATAVEWTAHDPPIGPLRADYDVGEDVPRPDEDVSPIVRSLSRPGSVPLGVRGNDTLRYPDAASGFVGFLLARFEDEAMPFFSPFGSVDGGQTVVWLGTVLYEGGHWNSTVFSHAYYLAVEGGRNETTGLQVQGVGRANRSQIERVFFRAMARFMPVRPSLYDAASALRLAAADLHGPGSAAYNAVTQALGAVGLTVDSPPDLDLAGSGAAPGGWR